MRPLLFLPGSPAPILVGRPPTGELRGSSGSQAQNADLGKQIGQQVSGELRAMVVDELRKQMRPGGVMY